MKNGKLMFLTFVFSFILLACSENNFETPDLFNGNQASISLNNEGVIKTSFTGTCTPVSLSPINTWYDLADDIRVTGTSIWITDEVIPIDEITFELKGTAQLTVDNGLGKWEMKWHGTQTLTSSDGSTFKIVAHAVGEGIEGDVTGLTAKWKYSLDFDGTPETLFYTFKGKITEDL